MHAPCSADGEGLAIGAESQAAAIALGTNDYLGPVVPTQFKQEYARLRQIGRIRIATYLGLVPIRLAKHR